MQAKHSAILKAVNNPYKKLNILTFPTHERYQSNFESMNHTFYLYQGEGIKGWTEDFAPLPKNHVLLPKQENPFHIGVTFDLVISQNKSGQFPVAKKTSDTLGIPLISLEHTLPFEKWDNKTITAVSSMRGDYNVYISEFSVKQWLVDPENPKTRVIHHGVNTDLFCPDEQKEKIERVLSVVNLLKSRNWCCGYDIYEEIKSYNFNSKFILVGDNPGHGEKAKDIFDLVDKYQRSSIFLNTSLISPVPSALLEAMSCGLPCVSTDTCMIPEIIKDGVNGFLYSPDKPHIAADRISFLEQNKEFAKEMGAQARKTILEKFSLKSHLENWDKLFKEAYGTQHRI